MPENITAQWVDRLKPPETGRKEYFDKKLSGFGLRVSFTGKKVWIVQFRVAGNPKKRRIDLGTYPQVSLAEAREKAQEVLLRASRGEDPAQEKQEIKRAPTFKDFAYDFLERYSKKQKRSWEKDEWFIEHEFVPAWGHKKAQEIKRRDVIELLDRIVDRGAPIQAIRALSSLKKMFNWGISRDIVESNPCLQVKPPAKEQQRDRVLTEGELRAVWAAIETRRPFIRSMFKLRILTAQRGGEIETMRWSDIDLTTAWWVIPAEFAKNGLAHRVPLSPPAMEILTTLRAEAGNSEWVFPSPTKKGNHIANIQKAADRIKEISGVDFVPHDLRRTAASFMTSMGISRLTVSKILNHVEKGVTRIYDRYSYDAEKRQALEEWANKLTEITGK